MLCKIKPVITSCNEKDRRTLIFAAYELQKYIGYVNDGDLPVIPTDTYLENDKNTIFLGVGLSDKCSLSDEDEIFINIESFSGIIAGSNARAVLIGMYRFLREKGFLFIRPGENGERIPSYIDEKPVCVHEKAAYHHRTICIEGSVFQENIVDMIDWIPKVSMNGYFIQFMLPKVFFDRWYSSKNPYRETVGVTEEEIRSMVMQAEDEIEKRGLMYHGVGHGWTTAPLGIDGTSWDVEDIDLTKEQKAIIAQVNGKRELWGGIPLNTNLCYSNKHTRDLITDNIVRYLKEHNNLTYLHFWLADGYNNNCECENCTKKRTSDYYVMMLNELDQKLTQENIDTKIVFLMYVDLLWKPIEEKIHNKERFVLMFAPITRTYSTTFDVRDTAKKKPYILNKLEFPQNIAENLEYLRDWQKDFDGDSFDFDYHYMWDHYYDFSQYKHAQILHQDIKNLKKLKLNGLVSCQVQRVFMPTSLGMNIMARTLWNIDTDFDCVTNEILEAEFGEDYIELKNYLKQLSETNCAEVFRGEDSIDNEQVKEKLKCTIDILTSFEKVIEKNLSDTYINSWEKIKFHNQLYHMMIRCYLQSDNEKRKKACDDVIDYAQKNSVRFKDEFDAEYFVETFETRILGRITGKEVII